MRPSSGTVRERPGFAPALSWLRKTVEPRISGCATERIKTNTLLTTVHRVDLAYDGGGPGCRSVIVKTIQPVWPDDPCGPDRERRFYVELAPRLEWGRPRVYHAGVDPSTSCRVIVMEDLADDYRFPPPAHRWTPGELRCALRAYARLHQRGQACLEDPGERTWLWRMALQQRTWRTEEILTLWDDLVRRGIWASAAGRRRLVERTLADQSRFAREPETLLHNDVFPPNVGLPLDPDGEAVLLDWEMLGWGAAELDLAFMFLQPFRSAEGIDRTAALDFYWEQRRASGGAVPAPGERQARQRHADALWTLSLLPVAHRAAVQPYPDGSAARAYWDAMFGVLGERLARLCADA